MIYAKVTRHSWNRYTKFESENRTMILQQELGIRKHSNLLRRKDPGQLL